MTERSDGAPDPVDPSPGGDRGAGSAQPAPAFWNLAAVRRSDAVVEALASRSALPADPAGVADLPDPAGPGGWRDDPAARLLRALVADVDAGAPELPDHRLQPGRHVPPGRPPRPGRPQPGGSGGEPGPGGGPRRGPRTIALLGVVGPLLTGVLATSGVAAAQSGFAEWPSAGERTGREREAQAKSQPGRRRAEAGRARDGAGAPTGDGARWAWPETRFVVVRTPRDGEEDDADDGAQSTGDARDRRKTRRPPPRTGGPQVVDPGKHRPWSDGSDGSDGNASDDAASPPRGARPFVQPGQQTPQPRQDAPGTGENGTGGQATDPGEADPGPQTA